MPEYIERQRAVNEAEYEFGRIGALTILRVPVANVTQVVRCGECVHKGSRLDKDGSVHIACYKMKDSDFCSYGERRPMMKT